jgi:alkylmercury lyase
LISLTEKTTTTYIVEHLPDVFMKLTKKEQELSLAIYRGLGTGSPISREELAQVTSLSIKEVNEILNRWTGIYYDNERRIIGYWGLSTQEMPHEIRLQGTTIWGWCAWDTLFIPGRIINTIR